MNNNRYAKDYGLFDKDSSTYSVSVKTVGQENGSFTSGPFFKGGKEMFKNRILNTLKEKLPFEENGAVQIKVSISNYSDEDESDTDSFVWRTHPIKFKEFGVEKLFSLVSEATNEANDLNQEYKEFDSWQNALEQEKENRKNGYYGYPEKDPTTKSVERKDRRNQKSRSQLEENQFKDKLLQQRHEINTPFENLSSNNKQENSMKIKLSKSQWEAVGQKAGWIKKAEKKCSDDCEGRHCKKCGKHIGDDYSYDKEEARYFGEEKYNLCNECASKSKPSK